MARSLRVSSLHISRVKLAVKRQGYPSQKAFAETLGFARATVSNFLNGKPVDYATFLELSDALDLDWQSIADLGDVPSVADDETLTPCSISLREDWSDAIDVSIFWGRTEELKILERWINIDRCRVIVLLGMGGIGKTSLAIKLAQQIAHPSDRTLPSTAPGNPSTENRPNSIIWRSLCNAPTLTDLLADLIEFLSDRQETARQLPAESGGRISRLLYYLRNQRCLLILDNVETILQQGRQAGHYRPGYEDYGELFRQWGMVLRQSCLILTSREKPDDVAVLEGDHLPVRSLQLTGLPIQESQAILATKGLQGTDTETEQLAIRYNGNPLALKIVATSIRELFGGEIATFFAHQTIIFNGIRLLLDQQFDRLSALEQQIMYWLAINREPVSLAELQADVIPMVASGLLLESLESLGRRCLIETVALGTGLTRFTQQPVVMEYVCDRLIAQVCREIDALSQPVRSTIVPKFPPDAIDGPPPRIAATALPLFHTHPLIKATAKDYIRISQIRLILTEVADRLEQMAGSKVLLEQRLHQVLSALRQTYPQVPSYAAGNWLNLCCYLQLDLTDVDLSRLMIWQADLRHTSLHRVNLTAADLSKSLFADIFSPAFSMVFSSNGRLLVCGGTEGEIYLWRMSSGDRSPSRIDKLLRAFGGHMSTVLIVCCSPNESETNDPSYVASGSMDGMVRVWEVATGRCLHVLQGHGNGVWGLSFSPDGRWLVSSGGDCMIRIWDPISGQCVRVLQGHTDRVYSLCFSPDGQTLVSGSVDTTARFWRISVPQSDACDELASHESTDQAMDQSTGRATIESIVEESNRATRNDSNDSIDFTDHQFMKQSPVDSWGENEIECFRILQAPDLVRWVQFCPQGDRLALGLWDATVWLWDGRSQETLHVLRGHRAPIWCLDFSVDGDRLVSGGHDSDLRVWDVQSGRCLKVLQGHTDRIYGLGFSRDLRTVVSSSSDHTVRLWDLASGQCLQLLQGHTNPFHSLHFLPDDQLVSGAEDGRVHIWNCQTRQPCQTLQAHDVGVFGVHGSADGRYLATGSYDCTAKIWDLQENRCLKTLQGHTGWLVAVRWSPDSQRIVTGGSADHTAKVWSAVTGECLITLVGHDNWVFAVEISPDGRWVATASADQTIRIWDIQTGECLSVLEGQEWICSLDVSPDGRWIAGGGIDCTVRLWEVETGRCVRQLQGHRQWIWAVRFSPVATLSRDDSAGVPWLLASGGDDSEARLWDLQTGNCCQILQGHAGRIESLAFSSDGRSLASCSRDETIILWDLETGDRRQTLRAERLYEGMNITDVQGVSDTEIATLEALGAVREPR